MHIIPEAVGCLSAQHIPSRLQRRSPSPRRLARHYCHTARQILNCILEIGGFGFDFEQ
jgi:hypothetical protein